MLWFVFSIIIIFIFLGIGMMCYVEVESANNIKPQAAPAITKKVTQIDQRRFK